MMNDRMSDGTSRGRYGTKMRLVIVGSKLTASLGSPRHSSDLDDVNAPPKLPKSCPIKTHGRWVPSGLYGAIGRA